MGWLFIEVEVSLARRSDPEASANDFMCSVPERMACDPNLHVHFERFSSNHLAVVRLCCPTNLQSSRLFTFFYPHSLPTRLLLLPLHPPHQNALDPATHHERGL